MKAYCVIAAALAAFAIGFLQTAPSLAAQPLQLTGQKLTAPTTSKRVSVRQEKRKRAAAKAAPAEEQAEEQTADASPETPAAEKAETPLPVVVVRTTREPNDEGVAVVAENEFNELDRVASSPSMMISTISNYIGGPVAVDETEGSPDAAVTTDARESFASEAPPPPSQANVALEYILMTFGGALAAAAAIRLFVV